MRVNLQKYTLAAVLLTAVSSAAPPERPRVALVLGGGAALGLAHVGVLQWLEENRIPVDIVAGTSMGGLVAGLYATGHDAAEIRQFIAGIDWEEALSLGPSFQQSSFRRRQDRQQFPSGLELGIGKGLHLPAGLSAGQGVGIVLSRFTAPYGDVQNFDQLPIPFACVAVDLVEGRKVVHRRGRLFDALRSTMAIPGLFTPWKIDDMVLVDGGLLDNLPVDVARSMGADLVIAVVLETPPVDAKSVQSLLGVAGRSISVMIANNEKASMAHADIVVAPQMDGFRSTDYQRAEELRLVGYGAARESPALRKLALAPAEWEQHIAQRRARRRDLPTGWKLAVTGAGEKSQQALSAELSPALAGPPFDSQKAETALNAIPGLGTYDSADYRFDKRVGEQELTVNLRPKAYGRQILQLMPQFDAASGQGSLFGLGGRLKFIDFGSPGSELRIDAIGGAGENGISAEYFARLQGRPFFFAPQVSLDDQRIPFRKGGRLLAEMAVKRRYVNGDAGWSISRSTELRAGVRFYSTSVRLASGTIPVPESDGNGSALHVSFKHLGHDSALVPRAGLGASTDFQWIMTAPGNPKPYAVISGALSCAHPLGPRYSILTSLSGGASPNRAGADTLFTLGGTGRLSALDRNQLFGQQYFLSQAGLLREVGKSSFARFYAASFYEAGTAWLKGYDSPVYHAGTMGIIGETILGVVYFGGAIGDKGERKIFFRLGRLF